MRRDEQRRGPDQASPRHELGDGRAVWGEVDAGFGPVMDAFVDNFTRRHDLGGACTVVVDGRVVVDLWGGVADTRTDRAWTRDTAAVIFSCSKGILAVCAYVLVEEGRLDLDSPMTAYWPEFGRHGKHTITVRDAMSHRGGVPALETDLTRTEVLSWRDVIAAIEEQPPVYGRHEGHAYHALTYGWLVGEVVRRVTGMLPGRFLQARISQERGLRTWIGLPAGLRSDLAWMEPPLGDEDSADARRNAALFEGHPIVGRSLTMGGAFAFPADETGHVTFNDADIQAGEIPGANGISSAESLARLYAACVAPVDDHPRLLTDDSIRDALVPLSAGPQLTGTPDDGARWGSGFQLASPPTQPMLGPTSFGHAGAGGQLAFADLDHRAAFTYLSNQMGGYGDARSRELTRALARSLGA